MFSSGVASLFGGNKKARLLPKPTGPFAVGFIDYEWSPPACTEHTRNPPAFALTRLFYPSQPMAEADAQGAGYEDQCGYWIPSPSYLPGYGYYLQLPRVLSAPLFRWLAGHLRLWGVEGAPLLPAGALPSRYPSRCPVIIFSHGLGGFRTTYSTLCTDLASHGFVVAAIEHRDGSAAMTLEQEVVRPYASPSSAVPASELHEFRAKQLAIRAQEVSANIDLLQMLSDGRPPLNLWKGLHPESATAQQTSTLLAALQGRVDLDRVVGIGHSFGGGTCIFAASQDDRIGAVAALDPWMYPLPTNFARQLHLRPYPLLVVYSEAFGWENNLSEIKDFVEVASKLSSSKAQRQPALMFTLRQAGHADFSDMGVGLPAYAAKRFRPADGADPAVILRNNGDLILAFLKQHLGYAFIPLDPSRALPPLTASDRFQATYACTIDYM